MQERQIGVWLVGALGSISAAVMIGIHALRNGRSDSTGMVTATTLLSDLDLIPVEAIHVGGCDIRRADLRDSLLEVIGRVGGLNPKISLEVEEYLAQVTPHISSGITRNCGAAIQSLAADPEPCGSVRDQIDQIRGCISRFKESMGLDEVVVVNLASTEPPLKLTHVHEDVEALERTLDSDGAVQASTLYAYAAIQSGCPYINFTPSNGAIFPAMVALAERNGVPLMGDDGKTGETLVKSALAPMFTYRNLRVLSWEGFNILGNMDGLVLNHPENRESKIASKQGVLTHILGYEPHSQVGINYVPSLGDQKVAWDFVHFEGFLGARMSLQFVWQGYDSLLAAPLVLDLVRLADLAKRRGEAGLMPHLACFFKSPVGVHEHRLHDQFRMLTDYAAHARTQGQGAREL